MAAADAFGPPGGVPPVGGPGGPGGQPLRAPVVQPATQATIVSRPPGLTGTGPVTVTGAVGVVTADGLLPLATGFGTLLLRPVPGAWPGELPPGTDITLTLQPGGRAGGLRVEPGTGAAIERAVQAGQSGSGQPVSARAIGGAEAGLRGLLLPAPPDAAAKAAAQAAGLHATATRHIASGQAVAAAQPNAPGPAQTPAASPGLLSAAAAAQPRGIPTPPAAVPLGVPPGPRGVAAPDTAAAVTGAKAAVGSGGGDLLREAGLRPPGTPGIGTRGPSGPGAPAMPAEETLAPAPPPPRSDQQLLAAFSHPGMMARMAALLPGGDRGGGLALMLYLFGVRSGGGARLWIGEEGLSRLTRGERAALDALDAQMVEGSAVTRDGRRWSTVLLPWLEGEEVSAVLLATPDRAAPVDPDGTAPGAGTDPGRSARFVLGVELSTLGPVQIRGHAAVDRLHLSLTIAADPGPPARDLFEAALRQADTAAYAVRIRWGSPPDFPDLMPSGGAYAGESRI